MRREIDECQYHNMVNIFENSSMPSIFFFRFINLDMYRSIRFFIRIQCIYNATFFNRVLHEKGKKILSFFVLIIVYRVYIGFSKNRIYFRILKKITKNISDFSSVWKNINIFNNQIFSNYRKIAG